MAELPKNGDLDTFLVVFFTEVDFNMIHTIENGNFNAIFMTYHQSQLKICCWNRVPLGHDIDCLVRPPLPSFVQT